MEQESQELQDPQQRPQPMVLGPTADSARAGTWVLPRVCSGVAVHFVP